MKNCDILSNSKVTIHFYQNYTNFLLNFGLIKYILTRKKRVSMQKLRIVFGKFEGIVISNPFKKTSLVEGKFKKIQD